MDAMVALCPLGKENLRYVQAVSLVITSHGRRRTGPIEHASIWGGKMRQVLVLVILVLALAVCVCGTEEQILIRPGTAPKLDGKVELAEWWDASGVRFCAQADLEVQVLFKHDATYLYFAFVCGANAAGALVMPEIAIDPALDRSPAWATDDWWFHVSGSDCEAKGRYDVYTACAIDHGDWSGVPNFSLSPNPAPLNAFEIRIPLRKIGVSAGDSIGIAFSVLYNTERRSSWPFEAAFDSPATWAHATLVGNTP
jgi:hypothetical protein